MQVYYVVISLIFLLGILAEQVDWTSARFDSLGRYRHSQATLILYFMMGTVLVFVAGMRYQVGTDFSNYYSNYIDYANEFFDYLKTLEEPGFRFVCWTIVKTGGNGATVIFVAALITIGLFLRVIYQNTDRLLMSTLLFVFLGGWHGCFNAVRQYLAAAIIFTGIRYIKQRNFVKYCLIIFCAFLFHSSAILLIFAYFVAYRNVNIRNIVIMIGASIVILFSFEKVMEWTSVLLNADYSREYAYLTRNVNVFRVLVAVVPAVFFGSMYKGKVLAREDCFWINMLILNAIVMFATSNSAYLARMGIYTAPFSALAIPKLMEIFNTQSKKILNILIIMAYAIFWWYEISNSYALNNFRFIWEI